MQITSADLVSHLTLDTVSPSNLIINALVTVRSTPVQAPNMQPGILHFDGVMHQYMGVNRVLQLDDYLHSDK